MTQKLDLREQEMEALVAVLESLTVQVWHL